MSPNPICFSSRRKTLASCKTRVSDGSLPDLVVEILSSSSIRRDRYEKLEQNARFGVKEYRHWIVDPANHSLEILTLQGKQFVVHSSAVETGRADSQVLAGLSVDRRRRCFSSRRAHGALKRMQDKAGASFPAFG